VRLKKKLELLWTGTWLAREQEARTELQGAMDDIKNN
jgi:hypothetical protein